MALADKTVVFTGTLKVKRAEAKKLAEDAGARVTTSVSSKTSVLVTGSSSGSALHRSVHKAKNLGIEIWTEEMFFDSLAPKKKKKTKKKGRPVKSKKKPKAPAKKKRSAKEMLSEDDEMPPPKKKKRGKPKISEKPDIVNPHFEDEKSDPEMAKVEEPDRKKKKKSSGPRPDRRIPNADNWTVDPEYHIKLNQTNIGFNNNKYYIIQLLSDPNGYALWTRWGRVGEPGQNSLKKFGGEAAGRKAFEKKFRDKTKNSWFSRDNFVKVQGKYDIVETEEVEGDGGDEESPIGKLSESQIAKGQKVLAEIETALDDGMGRAQLIQLSSKFFTVIPTVFGRSRPVPITTMDMVHENEERLKFYLRMGFEELEDADLDPISGVADLPLPTSLKAAASSICSASDIKASDKKGKELAKKQAGNPKKKMAAHLYAAIMLYTSNAIYRSLNKVLREENRKGVKKYFKYLRLFLEAMKQLPAQQTSLFRGISVDLHDQYKVGSTVTWWGVSSCTSEEQVARNFMNGCGGKCTFFTLDVKSACDISCISFYSNEKESLLAPGTELKVKSKTKKGKITEIHLEEVGRVVC